MSPERTFWLLVLAVALLDAALLVVLAVLRHELRDCFGYNHPGESISGPPGP